jgi:two-component system phosphate regulon sensor histidine kinase PhoR
MGELARALETMSVQLDERMKSLSHERNQLRAVLASMLEGVVAVDCEERVVHMNHVAAALLGTSEADAAGKRFWELVRVQEIGDILKEVLSESADRTSEVSLNGATRVRLIEVHASPLRGPDGEIAGAVMVLFDVTELRHLETVRREFVANVSHELKTPLTAIRGFIETILEDADADEDVKRRFLERARDQALRISTLVNDLLVLSRVESEQQALEQVPLDLREVVRSSARRVSPDIRGRDLHFETVLPDEPVNLTGDEEALRQAVDNLLDNAFKYTPDGGTVRLVLRTEGPTAIIEVSDTGIGIQQHHQARIFERFYRVDKARSRELGGTGLGLSIVKHIAESHRGSVSVSSLSGEGSVFRITLPLPRA